MSYKFYSSNYQNDNYNDNVTTTNRNQGDGFYSPAKNPDHHKKTIDEYKVEINDLISKINNILAAVDDSKDSDDEGSCSCGSCLGCTTTICDDGGISQHFYECDEDDDEDDEDEDIFDFDEDYAFDRCTIPWDEEEGDLLDVPVYYNIVHCIPTDCTLGSTIARRINDYYDIQHKIVEYYDDIEVGDVIWEDNVFTMFPTTNRYDKLTLKNLTLCLKNLANYCYHSQIKFIAMPHIGMGGGGLGEEYSWEFVREIILSTIEETLMNLDTDYRPYIHFCKYVQSKNL